MCVCACAFVCTCVWPDIFCTLDTGVYACSVGMTSAGAKAGTVLMLRRMHMLNILLKEPKTRSTVRHPCVASKQIVRILLYTTPCPWKTVHITYLVWTTIPFAPNKHVSCGHNSVHGEGASLSRRGPCWFCSRGTLDKLSSGLSF